MQGAGHEGGGAAVRRQKFFKVLLPGSSFASSLSLPPRFAARLDIPPGFAIATLRDPAGRSWHVDLDPRRRCFAGTGWRSFLAGTGASAGHLLVFEHLGGLRFAVELFDASGCTLDVRQHVDTTACSRSLRDEADDADMESGSNNSPWSPTEQYMPETKKRKPSPAAASAAGSSSSERGDESVLPRCIIERPFHLQYLTLTKALCDRLGWTATRTGELIVVGGGERRWEVRIKVGNKGGMIMSGWAGFAQDNGLRVSDSCVFMPLILALANSGDQLVQVQLTRGCSF